MQPKNKIAGRTQTPVILHMKKITFLLLAAAAVSVHAQNTISWAYDNGTTIPANGYAGVVSANNWNLTKAGGSVNLSYDNAGLSGTTLSLAGGFGDWGIGGVGSPDGAGTYNKSIFDGYYNCFSSTLTLGNISFANYNIYVYFSADVDGRTGTITDGTTTFSFATMGIAATSGANAIFTQTTDTGTSHPNADYAEFVNLSGTSKTLTIASNPNNGMGIAGIQIVATPEPGTMALAALGGVSLLCWRRRSMKA
jgi:hypothetical protein